jgi:SagB-type dehydrogenase family enzyme
MSQNLRIPLPHPAADTPLGHVLRSRRSVRQFSGTPITLAELAQLLWAAQGITDDAGKRAAPSAAAQYPLRLYIAVGDVSELPSGLYAYDPQQHGLSPLETTDLRPALADAAIGDQPWVNEAAVIIAVAANLTAIDAHFATQQPDGRRGARYAHMETGALCQNVHLQATALDLGMVLVGGFDDAAANAALPLSAGEETTALLCLGRV